MLEHLQDAGDGWPVIIDTLARNYHSVQLQARCNDKLKEITYKPVLIVFLIAKIHSVTMTPDFLP